MPDCILALDQGTSSSRAIVFDAGGGIVARAQRELLQHYPEPGWVEHDPRRIWDDQLACAREALAQAARQGRRVGALGISNQRETTLLWNRRSGEPLHRAIVWQDRRSEELCAQWHARGLDEEVRARTGLVLDPYFSATKLRWLLDHLPDARRLAARGDLAFGTVDSWLLWMLSGGADAATRAGALYATDVSNASRTLLWNIHRGCWDEELLREFDIPRELLPQVLPSARHWGDTAHGVFDAPLPVGALAGDQQAALFGHDCTSAGAVKNTYGTGCFLLLHTGARALRSSHGLLTTVAAQVPGKPLEYALEGSVFSAGSVVQWLRDELRAIASSAEVEALARRVPDAGGVMFVPAFTGLGAPYWQPQARATITGLSRGSGLAHIARAALESIAFQSTALLQAMQADLAAAGLPAVHELRVDGGASANDLLLQLQADLLGLPVLRPEGLETSAWGAARLAALGCGLPGFDSLPSGGGRRFEPQITPARAQERMQAWEHAVRQAVAV
jgi:glycerol kinase